MRLVGTEIQDLKNSIEAVEKDHQAMEDQNTDESWNWASDLSAVCGYKQSHVLQYHQSSVSWLQVEPNGTRIGSHRIGS